MQPSFDRKRRSHFRELRLTVLRPHDAVGQTLVSANVQKLVYLRLRLVSLLVPGNDSRLKNRVLLQALQCLNKSLVFRDQSDLFCESLLD